MTITIWPAPTTAPDADHPLGTHGKPLTDSTVGDSGVITALQVPAGHEGWTQQMQDLGFMPGERVTLMARGLSLTSPLVVRVGLSTYALRSAEAACVRVS